MLYKSTHVVSWTRHAKEKMRYYRLIESRVKRIVRHPTRIEEGILEGAIACMQPAGGKAYAEIWAMYVVAAQQIRIITAWRYPGKSPERDPVPAEVLREIRNLL
ncbi:MAG: hypothetical protein HY006_00035 [Candidatus Sungbacteria bacterium]|nr:hypothetical protein [Candidatus Sungbacteria bacterium]